MNGLFQCLGCVCGVIEPIMGYYLGFWGCGRWVVLFCVRCFFKGEVISGKDTVISSSPSIYPLTMRENQNETRNGPPIINIPETLVEEESEKSIPASRSFFFLNNLPRLYRKLFSILVPQVCC